ncbi:MAG: acyl carrier protein [Clostridia bacterium]|nr:acyl carrier protein [Clostridia bacterium]
MNRSEIESRLKDLLAVALGNKPQLQGVTSDSHLVNDLGLNSVGVLYLVIAIEEYFDIRFDDVGFGDFTTVGDVVDYVESKLQ